MITIPLVLLLIALFLEISVTNIPLVLLILIPTCIVYRNYSIFIMAFIFGILLDILTFKTVGLSSLFFISVMFLILIYEKKFEIKTNYFVILASFLGSILFILIFGHRYLIETSIISVLIGLLIFQVLNKLNVSKTNLNS